jgi:predicted RNA-binding protein with PUA domain
VILQIDNVIAENPFVGVWYLDPSQSKYEVGLPPQSATYRIDRDGERMKFSANWVTADGETKQVTFSGIADGTDHPHANPALAITLKIAIVDARTLETTIKKNKKEISRARRLLSSDCNIMTIEQWALNEKKLWHRNISVYKRL